MGNCTFIVKTVGAHGNVNAAGQHYTGDAEALLGKLVDQLREAGHSVMSAELTHGGEFNLDVGYGPKSLQPRPQLEPEAAPDPRPTQPG